MPAIMTPVTGSGDLTSTTTAVLAVYCLGSNRLTVTVVPTVTTKASRATSQRARRMVRNWVRDMAQGAPVRRSEDAGADVDDVLSLIHI